MVSAIDLGRTAAARLVEGWTGKRIVEFGGREDWSAGDVAAAFAAVLGRPMTPTFVPRSCAWPFSPRRASPPEVARELLGIYAALAGRRVAYEEEGAGQRRGTTSLLAAIESFATRVRAAA